MSAKMIKCKSCGNDIASNAKTCPNCGAKNKKPIFKKWWFWLIIIFLIVVIIGASGKGDTSDTTSPIDTVKQSDVAEKTSSLSETTKKNESENKTEETTSNVSLGKLNALGSAKSYLWSMAFSYKGLIKQLEYEGYTEEEAVYAADNCGADWNEQAAKSAKQYLDTMSFSRSGLFEQLEYEGFTHEQAVYGAESVGY